MHRLQLESIVGQGAFATVFKCRVGNTHDFVAAKKFHARFQSWEAVCELQEIRALMATRGLPHIVQMLELGRESDGSVFFTMKLEQGTLLDILQQVTALSEVKTRSILRQLLTGLDALHKTGFIHRDLKPENILVTTQFSDQDTTCFNVLIADLGSAVRIQQGAMTDYVTTRYYRSPEMVFQHPFYDFKVDMWSVGCIMYEALSGCPLFPAKGEGDLLLRICSVLGSPPCENENFLRISRNRPQMTIPSNFPKRPLQRWFEGTEMQHPSASCISLLEKLICWLPEARLDCATALRLEAFLDSTSE